MKRRIVALLAAIASLGLTASTFADAAAAPTVFAPFVGTYHDLATRKSATEIERAIERATANMNFVVRSIARKRLTDVNPPYSTLRIVLRGTDLITEFDGKRFVAGTDGRPRPNDDEGDNVNVSYSVEGTTLRGRYEASDGEKRYAFERSPDGRTMHVTVTVLSKHLSRPLTYEITYVRGEATARATALL